MNARQIAQAQEIFGEALDLDAADCPAFVAAACGENEEVRKEVDALLASINEAGRFLATPTSALDSNLLIAASRIPSTAEAPGTRIGNYKLVQLIGEGGFGSVFMAEQEQPVRRTVALKIIKLGMDTKQVIARFEAERQALAMMDHPNIAQVFEAGATVTGRPYFVMELVRGVPITTYSDENKLSPSARMELFVDVCQAVQHAHQKGIIHRDLKPSNVLVTMHDGKPVPKVIDFGIAKATNARLTERTIFTEHHQFVGTPQYISPEQALSNDVDIDTRSDVYSLGVLLYELLTGTTPFEARELREAGYEQIGKMIREAEPPRPSTRLSTMKESLPAVAALRATDAKHLAQLLRGELDWIVMKCLEKDRTRRYDAASDLCADVKRHLADEPVLARPTSASYRLWKQVRRHKAAVLAVSVALFGLIAGLAAASYGLVRATHDRDDAIIAHGNETKQRQAAEAANILAQIERASALRHEASAKTSARQTQEINHFLEQILAASRPELALGKTVLVRDVLDAAAVKIDGGTFKDQPEIEARIRQTLGRSYESLGEFAAAEVQLRKGLAQARKAGATDSDLVAVMLGDLAEAVGRSGEHERAVTIDRDVLAMLLRLKGERNAETAGAMEDLARNLMYVEDDEEAESLAQHAMQIRQQLGEQDTAGIAFDLVLLSSFEEEDADREEMLRQGLAIQRKLLDPNHPDLANSLADLGDVLVVEEKLQEAKGVLQESLAIKKKILPPGHPDFEPARTLLWQALYGLHDWAALAPVLLDHYEWLRKNNPQDPAISDIDAIEKTYAILGEADNAKRWHKEMQAGVARKLMILTSQMAQHPSDPGPLEERAQFEGRIGRFQQAADDFARAIEIDPENHQNYYYRGCLLAYLRDTVAYRELCTAIAKRFAESNDASILDRTAKTCLLLPGVTPVSEAADPLTLVNRALILAGPNDNATWISLCHGMALYRRGDYAASVQSLEAAMKPGDDFRHPTAQMFLAMAQKRLGQHEQAQADLKAAKQDIDAHLTPADGTDIGEGNLENWLMCQVARREAEELFAGSAR